MTMDVDTSCRSRPATGSESPPGDNPTVAIPHGVTISGAPPTESQQEGKLHLATARIIVGPAIMAMLDVAPG